MLVGGSDIIIVALTWTLSLLLNNPHVMQKAQEELDIQVGRNKLVDESHTNSLVYLLAIAKESLRLYPQDVKGNRFKLIPFGAGRRICTTLVLLHLTLANLLHAFEITKPSNEPIDMSSNLGIKETPLEVLLASRLSPDLYN